MFFLTPWVTRLLVANVVAFVLTMSAPDLFRLLAFVPGEVLVRPWTLVTYMFLHGSFSHILFNMLALFFFGPRIEDRLGGRSFLILYFLAGIGGALLTFVFEPMSIVVGASGGVLGVMAAFAYYWPDEQIFLMGLLPMPAWVFVIGLTALSIWSGTTGRAGGIAHFAHLGGLAFGYGYVYWKDRARRRRKRKRRVEKPNSHFRSQGVRNRESAERWRAIPLDELHEVNREEVERLLEKLEDQGVREMTRDERAFLDRMADSVGLVRRREGR